MILRHYRYREFRHLVSFPQIQPTLQRIRLQKRSNMPATLARSYKSIWHFAQHFESHPEDLSYVGADGLKRSLQGKLIKSSSKTYHYLMWDNELMSQFTENETFWDGTFESRPKIKNVGQFFTIMGMKHNTVSCNTHSGNFLKSN